METEEAVVGETILAEEEIEPFDWEDYLYESWLEKCLEKEKRKLAEAGIQVQAVVNIGTRAIISIDGKPMLATHWDGYPASLGADLLHCNKSIEAVIEVAKAHTIDSADTSLLDTLNAERVTLLAEKHQLPVQEIKAGARRGNVICAHDFVIADLKTYRDLAEFQYDIRGNEVFVRSLDGWWPEALRNAEEFRRLTAKEVDSRRAE